MKHQPVLRSLSPVLQLRLLLCLPLLLLLNGCANVHVERGADGSVKARAMTLFSNTAVKGLTVDGSSKTNLLHVSGATTTPNSDSITATGEAFGNAVGAAAKAAAK